MSNCTTRKVSGVVRSGSVGKVRLLRSSRVNFVAFPEKRLRAFQPAFVRPRKAAVSRGERYASQGVRRKSLQAENGRPCSSIFPRERRLRTSKGLCSRNASSGGSLERLPPKGAGWQTGTLPKIAKEERPEARHVHGTGAAPHCEQRGKLFAWRRSEKVSEARAAARFVRDRAAWGHCPFWVRFPTARRSARAAWGTAHRLVLRPLRSRPGHPHEGPGESLWMPRGGENHCGVSQRRQPCNRRFGPRPYRRCLCVCVNHEWRRWRQKKKLPKKKASYPSRGSGHVNDICEQHSVCEQQWQTVNEGVRSRKWIGSVVRFRVLVPETRDYFFFFLFSGRER